MTTGPGDTHRNRIARVAHDHGWQWEGWGSAVTISRGQTSIRVVFTRGGAILRAFNGGERYAGFKVGRDKRFKVVDQIIRDLTAGPSPIL